jgi:hypothetical protein
MGGRDILGQAEHRRRNRVPYMFGCLHDGPMPPHEPPAPPQSDLFLPAGTTAAADGPQHRSAWPDLDGAEALAVVRALHPAWPPPPAALLRALTAPALADGAPAEPHNLFQADDRAAPPASGEEAGTGLPA